MADKQKVLKGLEHCSKGLSSDICPGCPYYVIGNMRCNELPADALELINELERMKSPKFIAHSDGTLELVQKRGHWNVVQESYDDEEHWQCSACGCEWYLEAGNPEENNMHYCPECGALMDEDVKKNGNAL